VTGLRSWGPEEARRLEAVLAMPPPERQALRTTGLLDAVRRLTVRA
jgi:hypothetical protein